jgi:predicted nucleotidyltransferase
MRRTAAALERETIDARLDVHSRTGALAQASDPASKGWTISAACATSLRSAAPSPLRAPHSDARRDERIARFRRLLELRAMVATGTSQRQIADALGVTQPAVSQQLKAARELDAVDPEVLLEAAGPVLTALAAERGYSRLAVFGSVARGRATRDSDIDLLVEAPEGTSTFDFLRFRQLIENVLGRDVDLVSYGGLKPGLDDDIHRDAVPV